MNLRRRQGFRMRRISGDQRGIALVMVLLVLALMTIVTTDFAFSSMVYSHLARNSVNGLQASLLARSGINLGEAALLYDNDPNIDSFLEEWCPEAGESWCRIDESLLQLPDRMRLRIQIFDEGGKLNVNFTRPTLTQIRLLQQAPDSTQPFQVWQNALRTLIEGAGADPAAADRLGEYWTNIIESMGQSTSLPPSTGTPNPSGGGTDAQNKVLDEQLRQTNFPSLDDANTIMALDPRALQRLRKYVTALPFYTGQAKLNVNTAPREVLQAVIEDEGVVENIMFQRETAPLDAAQINTLKAGMTDPAHQTRLGYLMFPKTDYFRIVASAIVNPDPLTGEGGLARSSSVLVRRMQGPLRLQGGNSSGVPWTLTRLDWQKIGGAVLFEESQQQDPENESAAE